MVLTNHVIYFAHEFNVRVVFHGCVFFYWYKYSQLLRVRHWEDKEWGWTSILIFPGKNSIGRKSPKPYFPPLSGAELLCYLCFIVHICSVSRALLVSTFCLSLCIEQNGFPTISKSWKFYYIFWVNFLMLTYSLHLCLLVKTCNNEICLD